MQRSVDAPDLPRLDDAKAFAPAIEAELRAPIPSGDRYRASEFHKLVANGVPHEVGGRRQVQFAKRRCPMTFNGLETDREDIGNFLVSVPFGNELDHRFLARRKSVIGSRAASSQNRSEQRLRHSRGEERLMLR